MLKIKKAIAGLSDEKLSIQVSHLVEQTTGNSHFPTPNPSMAALSAKNSAFKTKVMAIKGGDHSPETVTAKNILRAELVAMVTTFFNYVLNTGLPIDAQVSSGFPLSKERTSPGMLPMPVNFSVLPSGKHTVKSKFDAVKGAHSYIYQHRIAGTPEGEWTNVVDTRCRTFFKDLQQGACYQFRVCAVGPLGAGEFTNVADCYVS